MSRASELILERVDLDLEVELLKKAKERIARRIVDEKNNICKSEMDCYENVYSDGKKADWEK